MPPRMLRRLVRACHQNHVDGSRCGAHLGHRSVHPVFVRVLCMPVRRFARGVSGVNLGWVPPLSKLVSLHALRGQVTPPTCSLDAHTRIVPHATRFASTCIDTKPRAPLAQGAGRSLEHHMSSLEQSHCKRQAEQAQCATHRSSRPCSMWHRPASRLYTSARTPQAAHKRHEQPTARPARDNLHLTRACWRGSRMQASRGVPRSCQPRQSTVTPDACHTRIFHH